MPILVDLIMYEVLCGLRSARQVSRIRQWFDPLLLAWMLDCDLVPAAVANYQALRRTSGTVDMSIGTYRIETGAELLTADRDFAPLRDHLGLRPAASA